MSFFTKEYAEFHMQRPLFDIITAYRNVLHWKSKCYAHALVFLLHMEVFILENTKISIFGGISKFLELIVFEKILVVFGNFE
jgi:hypothetical protein